MQAVNSLNFGNVDVHDYIRRVYNYMSLGVFISAVTAYVVYSIPDIYIFFMGSWLKWVVLFAPLALIFVIANAVNNGNNTLAKNLYFALVACNGIMLSSYLMYYTSQSIVEAFFVTGLTYAITGYVGYKTKKDLSAIGQFAMFAVIGLVVASIINIFFYSSTFHFILSILVILVFSALNAYDHQQIKQQALQEGDDEGMAIMSSVGLYINFLNLFTAFMHLLGVRE